VQIELYELLSAPAGFFLYAGKRVYWVYLLSALAIASLVVTVQSGKFNFKDQLASFLDYKYWFARSSHCDFFLMLVNSSLRILLLIPLFGSHLALTVYVGSFLQDHMDDGPNLELN